MDPRDAIFGEIKIFNLDTVHTRLSLSDKLVISVTFSKPSLRQYNLEWATFHFTESLDKAALAR